MTPVALAVLAHPDDAEIVCAGTLIRLIREHGWQVALATMTPGDCGSAEHTSEQISSIRRGEAATAAGLIGASYTCLDERDLGIFVDARTLAKTTRLLRDVQPHLVLTHSPDDYHPDHEATSRVVRAACFAAPVPLFDKVPGGPPPLAHIPHVYYCDPVEGKDIFGREIAPSTTINISSTIDDKTAMLASHASQREWLRRHHGIDHYLVAMRDWSAKRGATIGAAFGEGFRQHLGHGYPQNDLLKELLPTVIS